MPWTRQSLGGLRVDSREALLRGGDSGPALIPGNTSDSRMLVAVRRTDEHLQMPPSKPLDAELIRDLEAWVAEGANWPQYEAVEIRTPVFAPLPEARAPNHPDAGTSLQLWLRSDGQPWENGQPIVIWEDSSGRGHDLAATSGNRLNGTGGPGRFVRESSISGYPAVRFDEQTGLGGNAATAPQITGDGEFSLLLVGRFDARQPTHEGLIAGFGEPAHPGNPNCPRCALLGLRAEGPGRFAFVGGWGNDAAVEPGPQILGGPPLIIAITKSAGSLTSTTRFFVNGKDLGALSGHSGVPDFGHRTDLGFMMGKVQNWSRGFTGDIAEVVLYNKALSPAERSALEVHLSSRYRIPLFREKLDEKIVQSDPAFSQPHWAFRKIVKPAVPDESTNQAAEQHSVRSSSTHPVDRFVDAALREKSLTAVPQADTRTLVRRLYFDLHGLPPSAADLQRHVADLTPWNDAAWKTLIDELLESPRYGERWGRHWMDVVRYADTAGDNADYPIPEARYYRDYIIDAFNEDLPFDEFIREQLAGDILAESQASDPVASQRHADRIAATGFLALSRRYATGPYELWHLTLEDTIDTTGQAFLGLTLKCARCHDHKFDPVTQRDYYGLYGIFDSTQFPWAGAEEFASQRTGRMHFPVLKPQSQIDEQLTRFKQAEQQLDSELKKLESEDPAGRRVSELMTQLEQLRTMSATAEAIAEAQRQLDEARGQLEARRNELRMPFEIARRRGGMPAEIEVAYAVREGAARAAFIQVSGDPGRPGEVVPRGVPAFLSQVPSDEIPESQSGRRQLADWLTHPDHPLTARVIVNRIWAHHFGRGIVATPSNFGTRGSPPTHPELLDWLAATLIESGWSIKSLHRTILTSETWRRSSQALVVQNGPSDQQLAVNEDRDPSNEYLWRFSRRRLDAESIRDSILLASGSLDLSRPPEHPFPPIQNWGYTQHSQFRDFYPSRHRSVYLMTTRLQRHPFLALFDGPDTNTTTVFELSRRCRLSRCI